MIEQYKVFWQHKDKALQGEGQNPTTFEVAKAWVNYSNKEHPEIDHWVSVASFDFDHAQKMRLYPRS